MRKTAITTRLHTKVIIHLLAETSLPDVSQLRTDRLKRILAKKSVYASVCVYLCVGVFMCTSYQAVNRRRLHLLQFCSVPFCKYVSVKRYDKLIKSRENLSLH